MKQQDAHHGGRRKWTVGLAALVLIIGLIGLVTSALAQDPRGPLPSAKLQQVFLEAGKAYDEGQVDEAIGLYNQLVEQGYASTELFYNLGNAYFKSGRIGPAVLNYRRAWYYAPRDPDIRANLRFALQSAGATGPSVHAFMKPFIRLSRTAWIALATAFYWLAFIAAALFILAARHRRILLRVLVVFGVLLATSLAGVLTWTGLCSRPELVIMNGRHEALFAPLEGSTAHFALPEGSIVRQVEENGDWTKVKSGKRDGWIKRSACEPVCPWTTENPTYPVK